MTIPKTASANPKVLVLRSLEEAKALEDRVRKSAAAACEAVSRLLTGDDPLEVLRAVKFRRVGFDPVDAGRPLNLVEQVHQTFTYLTSIRGAQYLLAKHPEHAPFTLNLGTAPGPDIISADGEVAAETFAAVTPVNNNKLKSDIAKIKAHPARLRYVFYYAEEGRGSVSDGGVVQIVAVDL